MKFSTIALFASMAAVFAAPAIVERDAAPTATNPLALHRRGAPPFPVLGTILGYFIGPYSGSEPAIKKISDETVKKILECLGEFAPFPSSLSVYLLRFSCTAFQSIVMPRVLTPSKVMSL